MCEYVYIYVSFCLFVCSVRARERVIVNQVDFVLWNWCTKELEIMPLPRELPSTPCLSLQGALQKYVDALLCSVRMDMLCHVHFTLPSRMHVRTHTCDREEKD